MYKVIIVDRNGRSSKFMPKQKPVIRDGCIFVYDSEQYTLAFVIENLTSYSITNMESRFKEGNNEKE